MDPVFQNINPEQIIHHQIIQLNHNYKLSIITIYHIISYHFIFINLQSAIENAYLENGQ